MLVKMAEVLVKIAVMMMVATAAFRRHRKRGGEGPPSSSCSLTSSLDGRRVSPLVLGLHGVGGQEPLRDWIYISISAFPDSTPSPFPLYLEIRNSDWGESFAQIFLIKLAFLRQNKSVNCLTGGPRDLRARPGVGARPPISWLPRTPFRIDFTSQKS